MFFLMILSAMRWQITFIGSIMACTFILVKSDKISVRTLRLNGASEDVIIWFFLVVSLIIIKVTVFCYYRFCFVCCNLLKNNRRDHDDYRLHRISILPRNGIIFKTVWKVFNYLLLNNSFELVLREPY